LRPLIEHNRDDGGGFLHEAEYQSLSGGVVVELLDDFVVVEDEELVFVREIREVQVKKRLLIVVKFVGVFQDSYIDLQSDLAIDRFSLTSNHALKVLGFESLTITAFHILPIPVNCSTRC
jgi:hypothetical protein